MMNTKEIWCSSPKATGLVTICNGVVAATPPIWRKGLRMKFGAFVARYHIDRTKQL